MSTPTFKPWPQPRQALRRCWPVLLTAATLLTGFSPKLFAVATVASLGGGPNAAYVDGNTLDDARFSRPSGLCLDPSGTVLFVADYTNNAIRLVSTITYPPAYTASETTTFLNVTNGHGTAYINRPLAVLVDSVTNVFILNHGNGTNGTLVHLSGLLMNIAGPIFYPALATNLTNATAMAMDGYENFYVTVNSNRVIRITTNQVMTTVGSISQAGTSLQGIAVLDNGMLALTDAGNNGIWIMNPTTGLATKFSGFNGGADTNGLAAYAAFHTPMGIAKAGNGMLVVADCGNNKVKLVDGNGTVSLFFGVSSNLWVTVGDDVTPGYADGLGYATQGYAESRWPCGVCVGPNGVVYDTELYYNVIREAGTTGLTGPEAGYLPTFQSPAGLAYDSTDNYLYIANLANSTVNLLDLDDNSTSAFLTTAAGVTNPVALLVDTNNYLYVLNQGTSSGYILKFDNYGNPYGPIVTGLTQPTAFTLDGYGTFFITEQSSNIFAFGTGVSNTIVTVTNANTSLQGIALFDDSTIAVSDAGNHVLWQVNPITKNVSLLTGDLGVHGTSIGASNVAKLYQPRQLTRAGGDELVGADSGNNRLVLVLRNGTVTTNGVNALNSEVWFGNDNDPVTTNSANYVAMSAPSGVAIGAAGEVFDSEPQPAVIRGVVTANVTAPTYTPGVPLPSYASPGGIALNSGATVLYIATPTKNTISTLSLANNETAVYLRATNGLSQPVDVALDASDDLFVLNQGNPGAGYILEFDRFGNLLATNAAGLLQPTAMALDSSGDILVAESSGAILQFTAATGASNTIATVTAPGVQLQGVALFDDGTIVASDAGNDVIWQVDPIYKTVSLFTGQLDAPGTTLGSATFAQLNQPHQLKLAADSLLLAADSGNNRLVVIDQSGAVTNVLVSTNATLWFGTPSDPVAAGSADFVPMIAPLGMAIGSSGGVFASETYYDDIREILGTGISAPGVGGSGSGSATNIVIPAPIISPNSGYYPMGQTIVVNSKYPVYYTEDGSLPTTNSSPVNISDNIGYIHWSNTTNDLTSLQLRAFFEYTNASALTGGQPVTTPNIGVPGSVLNNNLYAGIGSSVVIPIVCNLATNEQIMSYQFRLEISPNAAGDTPTLLPLSIVPTNDFVPLVTAAQSGFVASNTVESYSLGTTNGLTIFALGAGTHILFKNYAVVTLLEVEIPYTATEGDVYTLNVLYPSATADAYNTPVPISAMTAMTIVVTNFPYLVGDSASTSGTWYNAGTFGDGNLDNSDVNQAFYAASGLRVPYSFTDVFSAMDAYPPDANGFLGGDGAIRYLDWNTILNRSLRLDTSDWSREWSVGGNLIDFTTNLVVPEARVAQAAAKTATQTTASWPWYRQVLLGAESVSYASPNATVYVPLYAQLADGSSLSGLQFRAVVTPQGAAPALTTSPQLALAAGLPTPLLTQSFKAGEAAFGWSLGSFNYLSRSSNFLGWISFTVPTNALTGQSYQVSLLNADGAPNATNQYDFETRSATVTVNAAAPAATICSDEWKIYFFGSTTNPAAADNADPDGDGVPNWMEFLAGTDPTKALSRLQITGTGVQSVKGQRQVEVQWLTAPGHAYEVQWATNVASGTWRTLSTISGTGSATNYPDVNPADFTRYYRLHVLP